MADLLYGRRVLVTGGLGFIGSNLARRCVELGAVVTIYDSLAEGSGANPANLEGVEHDLTLIAGDIRDPERLGRVMRAQDICFHAAARTSHVRSMTEPLADIDVNCKGVIHVLEAVRQCNPDVKLVHIATSTQVGPMRSQPIDERHAEFPVDVYSANKSVSEKYALLYAGVYKLRTTVVRLANVYGPRANIRSPDGGFVNYFVGLALQERPLTVFGHGRQLRNLMYVEDAVEALVRAALTDGTDGEVFFAVSPRHYRLAEAAEAIVQYVGGRVEHVAWPGTREATEIGDVVISGVKIARALQWTAQIDLPEGLIRTREFYRPRLAKYLEGAAVPIPVR